MKFDIVAKAGLHQTELAKLLGVSRLTAHNYMHGANPHKLIEKRVEKFLAEIHKLVANGTLPMKAGVLERERRVNNINKLKTYLDSKI